MHPEAAAASARAVNPVRRYAVRMDMSTDMPLSMTVDAPHYPNPFRLR